MKPVQKLLTVAAAGLFGALLVPGLSDAQVPGRPESTLTITERTEVPGGVILEPGSYVVKVSENQSNWNVVTIQSPDLSKTFATILATPHTAKDAIPHTTFVFFNTPAGQPKALRSWFPPNDRFGQDFVYNKQRGEELARLTNEKVPEETAAMTEYERTHPIESSATTQTQPVETTAMNEDKSTSSSSTMDTTAQNNTTGSTWRTDTGTSGSSTTMEKTPETTTAQNDTETTTRSEHLPRTASPFPLLALAGASALGLGLAVRRVTA